MTASTEEKMSQEKINQEKLQQILSVERAAADLRKSIPVYITNGSKKIIVLALDNIADTTNNTTNNTTAIFSRIDFQNFKDFDLIISDKRANYLSSNKTNNSNNKFNQAIKIKTQINGNNLSNVDLLKLSVASLDVVQSIPNFSDINFEPAGDIAMSALKLAKIAELIPAVLICEINSDNGDYDNPDLFLSVTTAATHNYHEDLNNNLKIAVTCNLNLNYAKQAKIIAVRSNIGGFEHYAIIIGNPDSIPLVRVHSSCYTGDLLASLSCDCRDQLQEAIKLMSENNGGIILYLMQEGRGIGLVNKLRAYNFKDVGMDTVDANLALGFDDDERMLKPAAKILELLDIKKIKLLTNNPRKADGLTSNGIDVVATVSHVMKTNEFNKAYIATKVTRMGHKI